jgi:hypothetical protein
MICVCGEARIVFGFNSDFGDFHIAAHGVFGACGGNGTHAATEVSGFF